MAIIFFLLFVGLCIVAGYISLGTIYLVTGAISTAWYKLSGKEAEDKQKDESEFEDIGGGKYRQCKTGRVCEWRGAREYDYAGYYVGDTLVYSEQYEKDKKDTAASLEKAKAEGRETYIGFNRKGRDLSSIRCVNGDILKMWIEEDNLNYLVNWFGYKFPIFYLGLPVKDGHLEINEISAEKYLNYAQPILEGKEHSSFMENYGDVGFKWKTFNVFKELGFIKYENYHFTVDQDRIDDYIAEQISKISTKTKEEIIKEWEKEKTERKVILDEAIRIKRWGETEHIPWTEVKKKLYDFREYRDMCPSKDTMSWFG